MNDLVSIIIPNYNRSKFALDTLNSVLNQTYRPLEIVIIDDHSTDDSFKVVQDFIQQNEQEEVSFLLELNTKKRAASARNYGFTISSGKYIQFLDSDDLLLPHKLETEIAYLKDSDFKLVYAKAQFFEHDTNNRLNQYWGRELSGHSSDYFEFPWQTMCALYSRNLIDEIGVWNEELSLNDDWEFSMRYLITSRQKIGFIDSVHSLYRVHDNDRVGNNVNLEKLKSLELSMVLTKNLLLKNKSWDKYLSKRFSSRFLYCAMLFGKMKKHKEKNRLLNEHVDSSIPKHLASIINSSIFYKLVLKIYENK